MGQLLADLGEFVGASAAGAAFGQMGLDLAGSLGGEQTLARVGQLVEVNVVAVVNGVAGHLRGFHHARITAQPIHWPRV